MKNLVVLCSILFVGASAATAHTTRFHSYTETREINLPFAGSFDAETAVGAVNVTGWDNDYVLVRARLSTSAVTEAEARFIAGRIEIDATPTRVRVSGPSGQSWGVGFDIFVPRAASLKLRTRVGAISVTDVAGDVAAATEVGAMDFTRLAGALDAQTQVGAIRIQAPPANASFDLHTNLGNIKTDMPGAHVEAPSFLGRALVFETGSGGARIHAETAVGQIELTSTSAAKP